MMKPRILIDAAKQAAQFERIREAHQSEMAEDYVEMIDDLIEVKGEARLVEIADRFGISHATASKTIGRLQREGLVTSEPYRSIFLTDSGKALADKARKRHQIVLDFLIAIGVSAANAEIDAEGMEHHVSEETLSAFQEITRRLKTS